MSIRILVVDDNVDIINNVREYLSLKGWTVEWCTTGSDALRRLQADPFDLLILDLGLPGLDGLTICRELRAAHSKLPILMLTGRDAIDDRAPRVWGGGVFAPPGGTLRQPPTKKGRAFALP